jgi:NAD(P)-dependent dehydrogenase (short-subunit alcohol dehydrogenase family)
MEMRREGRTENKVAIVTGATRGLGAAIAAELAAEGAKVAVTGRRADLAQDVVDSIIEAGGTAAYVALDLASEDSVAACVEETVSRFGGLDILVNNAAPTEYVSGAAADDGGVMRDKEDANVVDLTTDTWRKMMNVGLDGLFWAMKYAIPAMRADDGRGAIVNISSNVTLLGVTGADAYTAMKGAMNTLTRSVAVSYAPEIRCNAIIAGSFMTPALAPLMNIPAVKRALEASILVGEIAEPRVLAPAVAFLASDDARYITGQLLPVDGGQTLRFPLPDFTDELMAQT